MGDMSRRGFVASGVVGAVTAGGLAAAAQAGAAQAGAATSTATAAVKLTGPGAPDLPPSKNTYRFALTRAKPQVRTKGGTVTECTVKNFPVVGQSDAAIFLLKLEPGGPREPHWHPNAWELEYVVSGKARLGVVTPQGTTDIVDLGPGDVGFVPRGWGWVGPNTSRTSATP
jgi:oxalate decarboxylase